MSATTPVSSPARTRKRNADHLDSDRLDSDDALLPSLNLALQRVNGNHLESIIAFATRKRLRPDQITAVEMHAGDPLPVQLSKIYVLGLANENALAKFQAAKPPFEANSALKMNLTRAVNATLCSKQYFAVQGRHWEERYSGESYPGLHCSYQMPAIRLCCSASTGATLLPAPNTTRLQWTSSRSSLPMLSRSRVLSSRRRCVHHLF
jgi:hypothetical protein